MRKKSGLRLTQFILSIVMLVLLSASIVPGVTGTSGEYDYPSNIDNSIVQSKNVILVPAEPTTNYRELNDFDNLSQSEEVASPLSTQTSVYATQNLGVDVNGASNTTIYLGWGKLTYRWGLFKFNLSTIPKYSTIVKSNVFLYNTIPFTTGGIGILPFRIIEAWDESLSGLSEMPTTGETYSKGYDMTKDEIWYSWNVTSLVQGWVSNYYANHGMAFTTNNPTGGDAYSLVANLTDPINPPRLEITYTINSLKIEPPVPNPEKSIIMLEDSAEVNINLADHEHRRFEKYNSIDKPSVSTYPFNGLKEDEYHGQTLYFPDEIGMSGIIDKISFWKMDKTQGHYENFSVRLAHAPLKMKELASPYDMNHFSELVEVYNVTNLSINQQMNTWIVLDVENVFNYQSHYNLIVDIRWRGDGDTDILVETSFMTNGLSWNYLYYASVGKLDIRRYNLKFEVTSSDEVSVEEFNTVKDVLFPNNAAIRCQSLYRQSLIGQAGIVDKLYFQLGGSNLQTGIFENISLRLANTNLTELGNTFDNNYGSGTPLLVYPNSTRLLAGNPGTWLEFDVNNVFHYNNFDNLLVELRWRGSSAIKGLGTNIEMKVGYYTYVSASDDYAKTGNTIDIINVIKIKFKDSDQFWEVTNVNNSLLDVAGPDTSVGLDTISIAPVPNAFGVDDITLTLRDSLSGWSKTQKVTVHVEPVNDPPMIPYNLTPGNIQQKKWYAGPIHLEWEHQDVDSPQINVSIEYKLNNDGTWQTIYNSSEGSGPYFEPGYLWEHPVPGDNIYLRVRTMDEFEWSPWNESLYPIGFDNTSDIIQSLEVKDLNKSNTDYIRNGHTLMITATLTDKFFTGISPIEPIIFADLTAFGGNDSEWGNETGFPNIATWTLDDIVTTPSNGPVMASVFIPSFFGDPILLEKTIIADNTGIEFTEPSITNEQWLHDTEDINFTLNFSDDGSGVDLTTLEYQFSTNNGINWSAWTKIESGDSRGNSIIPSIILDLQEGSGNKVRCRGKDVIGNDYTVSPVYTINVDSRGVDYSDITPISGLWFRDPKVNAEINISDMVSGVNPATIMYQYSTNGIGSYGNWKLLPPENVSVEGSSFICKVELTFPEGSGNYIKWQAEDVAGHLLESDHLNYKIDSVAPAISKSTPPQNGWVNILTVNCSIDIDDSTSGIDSNKVEYKISTNGTTGYGPWQKANVISTRASIGIAEVTITAANQNYIQWRVPDVAGNIKISPDLRISVDTEELSYSAATPILNSLPSKWVTNKNVNCGITLTDLDSGVNAESIQYRFSTDGTAESMFGNWTPLGLHYDKSDNTMDINATVTFDYGEDNYIQWRAKDIAGNGWTISNSYQVQVQSPDSDNDGLPDWWEEKYNLNPTDSSDADSDSDNDGLSNLKEYELVSDFGDWTDPTNSDSDGDGVSDGDEVKAGSDPTDDSDTKSPAKSSDDGGFDYLWLILLVIIIIIVLVLVLVMVMRKRKPKEDEEESDKPSRRRERDRDKDRDRDRDAWDEDEEEEVEDYGEDEDEDVVEDEDEYEDEDEDSEEIDGWMVEDEGAPSGKKPKPEEMVDEDFIDIDLGTPGKPAKGKMAMASKPMKGKAPPRKAGAGEAPKKKSPEVIRRNKPVKVMAPAKVSKKKVKSEPEMEPEAEPELELEDSESEEMDMVEGSGPQIPALMTLKESTTCNICLGAVKTGLKVVKCTCGKKYHETCANRVSMCPTCDTDLTNPEPKFEEEEEMTEDDLEAFDIDELEDDEE